MLALHLFFFLEFNLELNLELNLTLPMQEIQLESNVMHAHSSYLIYVHLLR